MKRVETIHIPGRPLQSFDIGFVDDEGVYAATLPTDPHAHSAAADARTGKAFVLIAVGGHGADCANGCIAVFGPGEK